jgi:hypothetical protein
MDERQPVGIVGATQLTHTRVKNHWVKKSCFFLERPGDPQLGVGFVGLAPAYPSLPRLYLPVSSCCAIGS